MEMLIVLWLSSLGNRYSNLSSNPELNNPEWLICHKAQPNHILYI